MSIQGMDISSHQPTENWQTIKDAGVSFAAIKRTGGDGYTNPYGRAQVAGARAAGVLVIHYLYFGEPGYANRSGLSQSAFFIAEVGDDILPGEGISLDWEENSYASIDEALACLQELEAHYGFRPSIYTYPSYITEHGLNQDTRLARYPLWYASYSDALPHAPAPWSSLMAWQYSDNENIPGVGHVDGDTFFGTIEELRAFGKPGATISQADVISGSLGKDPVAVATDTPPHTDSVLEPIRFVWENGTLPGRGVVTKVTIEVYNPDEQKSYRCTWEGGQYGPWEVVN